MLKYKHFCQPDTLEEALKLNQGRANCVLGGTGWLKMGSRQWNNAIDLGKLGLDQIEETEAGFRIGAMVTLRQLELHLGLNSYTGGAVRGLRPPYCGGCSSATVPRWGAPSGAGMASPDVLTCFLALDTQVELAQGG